MIEEIQALMPLFEKISDGALTAFIAYLVAEVLPGIIIAAMWIVGGIYAIKIGLPLVTRMIHGQPREDRSRIELYRFSVGGKRVDGPDFIGTAADVAALLKAVKGRDSPYVFSSDVERAIRKLKEPNP